MHNNSLWDQLFESEMRQKSETIILCLGVILVVNIVAGCSHLLPEWEDDILEDYEDEFYVPVRNGRQIPNDAPVRTSTRDTQLLISQIAEAINSENVRQTPVASETPLDVNTLNEYANAARDNLEYLRLFKRSSTTVANGDGQSKLAESLLEAPASRTRSIPKGSFPPASWSTSLPGYGVRSEWNRFQSHRSPLGSTPWYRSANSQSNLQGSASRAGSEYRSTSRQQNSGLESNEYKQVSSEQTSLNSMSSSSSSPHLTNLNLHRQRHQLLQEAAILISRLSASPLISKSDIINIVQETTNDLQDYPSTQNSDLNFENQVLLNLIHRLKTLEILSKLKTDVQNILDSLNDILQSIENDSNGSNRVNILNPYNGYDERGRLSRPTGSSDSKIRNVIHLLNNIQNVANDLQQVVNNYANFAYYRNTVQDISNTLLTLVNKSTQGIDNLFENISASNHPPTSTSSSIRNEAPQSDQDNLELLKQQIQAIAENFRVGINSRLRSRIGIGILGSNQSANDNGGDVVIIQAAPEDSTSSNKNTHRNLAVAVNKLLNSVNSIVSNVLESSIEPDSRNRTPSLSPSNDRSKVLKIHKLLISLLNSRSRPQTLNSQNLQAQNSNSVPNLSNSLNPVSSDDTLTINETQTPMIDGKGNPYIVINGNYKIDTSSGTVASGQYSIDQIRTIENPNGSVLVIKTGPVVRDYIETTDSAVNSANVISQNNNLGETEPSNDNLNRVASSANDESSNVLSADSNTIRSSGSNTLTSSQSNSNWKSSKTEYADSNSSWRSSISSSSSNSNLESSGFPENTVADIQGSVARVNNPSVNSTTPEQNPNLPVQLGLENLQMNSDTDRNVVVTSSSRKPTETFASGSISDNNSESLKSILSDVRRQESIEADIQQLISTLKSLQSSRAKTSFYSENTQSSHDTESVISNSDSQTPDTTSPYSSSEWKPYNSIIRVNNPSVNSPPEQNPNLPLYAGLENLQINSGHDTKVVITPSCQKPTETSASGSISDNNSESLKSISSSSESLTHTSGQQSISANDRSSSSHSGSFRDSVNHYKGYDINEDTKDYILVPEPAGWSSGHSAENPSETLGQHSNSDNDSVTLSRAHVISAIGNEILLPGDLILITNKNGVIFKGSVNDSDGPITFVPSDPWILLRKPEGTGRVWKVSSSNFNKEDCERLEQCNYNDY